MSHCLLYRVVLNQPLMIIERTKVKAISSTGVVCVVIFLVQLTLLLGQLKCLL